MRETTYAYLVGAYNRILDDLKEAKALGYALRQTLKRE